MTGPEARTARGLIHAIGDTEPMVDRTENQGEADTPLEPGGPTDLIDQTIELDRAIAAGNLSLPSHFGRYQVTSRIGVGGFASVYAAVDPRLDSSVAIKVLAENHSADSEVRRRFVAEARVARRLASDRLIGVFDVGTTDDGRPFVVMELADGGTLRARLARIGRPHHHDLVRLIDELGACLTAIHDKGVVHRDIKPSNLLLRSNGQGPIDPPTALIEDEERLVLADFGLARDISDGASALTVGGGTAGYMAPEQADPKGKADFRADIYAATVVLAELTTGRHPERLDLESAPLPSAVVDALAQSLAIDREQRPASAAIWREELLAAYRSDRPTGALSSDAPSDRTAIIDQTRVQAPPHFATNDDYDDDAFTEIPATGMDGPRTFVRPPLDGDPPPPPPSLPINPKLQRPPPEATPPATPAQDAPVAAADEVRTEAQSEVPMPDAEPVGPPPQAPTPQSAPTPTPTSAQPRAPTAPSIATAPPPHPETLRPGVTPAPPAAQPFAPPAPPPMSPGFTEPIPPANQPVAPPGTEPIPPANQPVAPPGAGPIAPPANQPVAPAGMGPISPPISVEARLPGSEAGGLTAGADRQSAEIRSKKHLKTAQRLAKLEHKASQKRARKARRRRRRRRVANFFLAIVRGVLASVVTLIVVTIALAAYTGRSPDEFGAQAENLTRGLSFIAFFLGLSYFPFPRRLDV